MGMHVWARWSWGDAQGAWVTEKVLRPRPVTAELLAERIEGVDAAMGAAIVRALSIEGLLNATGFLVEDPRSHILTLQFMGPARQGAHATACL